MTCQNNRKLIEALSRAPDFNAFTDDVVLLDQAQERSFTGREAVTAFLKGFFEQGFTQTQTEFQTIVVEEEKVACAFLFRGQQDGAFMGIPPTHQRVAIPMVIICKLQAGRIKQAELYYNAGTLLRQLGLGL
jgi:steroid delta-isomerase-like uncharacterized protein